MRSRTLLWLVRSPPPHSLQLDLFVLEVRRDLAVRSPPTSIEGAFALAPVRDPLVDSSPATARSDGSDLQSFGLRAVEYPSRTQGRSSPSPRRYHPPSPVALSLQTACVGYFKNFS